jgi:hypothetical protein
MKKVLLVALLLVCIFFACRKEEPSHPELVLRYAITRVPATPLV